MVSTKFLAVLVLAGSAAAFPSRKSNRDSDRFPKDATCGEINVFYTGYPAFHPYVKDQGFDPVVINQVLRTGTADLVKAGYNVRVIWEGPEQPVCNIEDRIGNTHWHVNSIGFGIRGHRNATSSRRFEDIGYLFHDRLNNVPTVYNWGPEGFVAAITRRIPLKDDCTNKPGKLIAYEELCDKSICPQTTNILDGDLNKLLAF